jgi:SpoVK/Ycf46/Vps4 family AAA+-type ATPase
MYQVLENGGVLVLEDLDLWTAPSFDNDENQSFFAAQVNRGAQEVVNLLEYAVARPDVYVLATTTDIEDIDPFFLDLLEPASIVDIDLPTPEDRVQIWLDVVRMHPSLAAINKADLVRVSANMPRFDIYTAVKEAVEEAYRQGLEDRAYKPVTRQNLYTKLASFQPVDSPEYAELVDAVVNDFQKEIANIDDILKTEE